MQTQVLALDPIDTDRHGAPVDNRVRTIEVVHALRDEAPTRSPQTGNLVLDLIHMQGCLMLKQAALDEGFDEISLKIENPDALGHAVDAATGRWVSETGSPATMIIEIKERDLIVGYLRVAFAD